MQTKSFEIVVFMSLVVGSIALSFDSLAQTSAAVKIVFPAKGEIATSGDVIDVQVSLSPTISASAVQIFANFGYISLPKTTPPFIFTLGIPLDLVGRAEITAAAILGPGNALFSSPVAIYVESASTLVEIDVNISQMYFSFAGAKLPLSVIGTFSNDAVAMITQSRQTSYKSSDTSVAVVDNVGVVTAIGNGTATITTTYGSQSAQTAVTVMASVIKGDIDNDGDVDMDDLNIINGALNVPANAPFDARDLNKDGVVNALDARLLVNLCTRPRCATH